MAKDRGRRRIGYVEPALVVFRQADGGAQRRSLPAADDGVAPFPGVHAMDDATTRVGNVETPGGIEQDSMGPNDAAVVRADEKLQRLFPEALGDADILVAGDAPDPDDFRAGTFPGPLQLDFRPGVMEGGGGGAPRRDEERQEQGDAGHDSPQASRIFPVYPA